MKTATKSTARKSHPFADLFPMMNLLEAEALAADIAANGQSQPILLYNDLVLDGRNRLAACEKAGVEPIFATFEGDDASALAKVISLNVQRRDMTAGQRAIVAAKTWMATGDTKARGRKKGMNYTFPTLESVAAQFKSIKVQVTQARDLLSEAPDLATQVESCALSLTGAYEKLQDRRHQAKQRAADAAKAAEFTEAISSGEISVEQALQKVMEQEREQKHIEASQADSRRNALTKISDFVAWITPFSNRTDDELAWYGEPNSPGMINHGLTTTEVLEAAETLARFATNAFSKGKPNAKK